MSSGYGQQYGQYGGNPYGDTGYGQQGGYGDGGYGGGNPYGTTQQPYGGSGGGLQPPAQQPIGRTPSNYSQVSQYEQPPSNHPHPVAPPPGQPPPVMSNQDFLTRIEGAKSDIRDLSANISSIGTIHQRVLSSPDGGASSQLEHLVTQTQILNTRIKDTIKLLEIDAARSHGNRTKDAQVATLKSTFKKQLEEYQREESLYRQRYKEQIERQYRIVNPEASEQEVEEASNANWGDEGVFQTALKTNRSGHASSVLGAVRARHHDIQNIERTLIELNQLFQDLAEAVIIQEPAVQQVEEQTENVVKDSEAANVHLGKGVESARRARKLKWWCVGIVLLIIIILALVLGLGFGVAKWGQNTAAGR